jgi:transcription elongation factor Elf1
MPHPKKEDCPHCGEIKSLGVTTETITDTAGSAVVWRCSVCDYSEGRPKEA